MTLKITNEGGGDGPEYAWAIYTPTVGNDSCEFYINMLHGSCSTTVVHDFGFYCDDDQRKKVKFYKSLHASLCRSRNFYLNRSKLLLSAVVGSDLEEFAKTNNWIGDEEQYNLKSGNRVRIWTFNRGVRD